VGALSLPRIALGCGNFGGIGSVPELFGQGQTEDQARALMDAAWQAGITHFDTADAYGGGSSERWIGRWIAARGVRPTLTTKTFNPMRAGADQGLAPERVERQLATSLERLGADHVDLYLAHDFDPHTPLADSFAAFERAQTSGLIGAYGVSNFSAGQLTEALASGRPRAIQNSYSLLDQGDQAGVIPLCAERDVAYLAFGPLAGGWLTGKYRRGEPYPAGSRMDQRPGAVPGSGVRPDVRHAGPAGRAGGGPRHLDGRARAGLAAGRPAGDPDRDRPGPPGPPRRPDRGAGTPADQPGSRTGGQQLAFWAGKTPHGMIELAQIEAARDRIAGTAVRTPLVRLHAGDGQAEIYLKLESLQPINSFKIRGAANAVRQAPAAQWAQGLVTASAGNMAQGVAWVARSLGVPATIVVPDQAPQAKLAAIERLGGRVIKRPYDDWWNVIVAGRAEGIDGLFVHPVTDPAVMAGNGTIGLEILDDLPDPDAVVIPYGGGGLTCGIASAIKTLSPRTKIVTAEPEGGAALAAALAAGGPATVDFRASFVDGAGSRRVLDSMWPQVAPLVDRAVAVPVADAAAAVRTLAERARVIAEGAGALATAAALAGQAGPGKVACVVSGGNLDLGLLSRIFNGAHG
jgi:threonine dehydratase/aryl-alcohol dehydrogenase-like predicted oxidoreductase